MLYFVSYSTLFGRDCYIVRARSNENARQFSYTNMVHGILKDSVKIEAFDRNNLHHQKIFNLQEFIPWEA
jgi:hypothetical protein